MSYVDETIISLEVVSSDEGKGIIDGWPIYLAILVIISIYNFLSLRQYGTRALYNIEPPFGKICAFVAVNWIT